MKDLPPSSYSLAYPLPLAQAGRSFLYHCQGALAIIMTFCHESLGAARLAPPRPPLRQHWGSVLLSTPASGAPPLSPPKPHWP